MNFLSSGSGIHMAMGRRQRQDGQGQGESKLQESRRKTRRRSTIIDARNSVLAMDEAASAASSAHEGDEDDDEDTAGRPSGWRRADRLARATAGIDIAQDPLLMSTSRLELQREKGILEDALKDSLSTLLMLRPANASTKLPDFLTAPQQSHTSPLHPSKSSDMSEYSLSTSPSSTVTATAPRRPWTSSSQNIQSSPAASTSSSLIRAEERGSPRRANINRRRTAEALRPKTTDTVNKGKSPANTGVAEGEGVEEDLSANWAEATLSSTSSFEDLGFDDFEDDDDDGEVSPIKRKSSLYSIKDRHTTPKARRLNLPPSPRSANQQSGSPRSPSSATYHARTTPRPRRPSKSSSALRRSAPPSYGLPRSSGMPSGIQSEPELYRDDLKADETFLELLEAAKTFMSMSPSAISSSSTAGSILGSKRASISAERFGGTQRRTEQDTADTYSRATTPPSPHVPTSMSTSTTFVLSSSDSPPSHGLASSREGLDDEDDESQGYVSPIAPEQTTDASLSSTVRNQRPAEVEAAHSGTPQQQEAGEKYSQSEDPCGISESGGWWDWLSRQYKKITVGIGLLGIGFVIAVGVRLLKKPSIRRSVGPSSQGGLFTRISFVYRQM